MSDNSIAGEGAAPRRTASDAGHDGPRGSESSTGRSRELASGPDAGRWDAVLEQLVAERGDALTRYAYLLCGNREDAVDLVHDALVKTFGRLRNGFTLASGEAYVRRSILTTFLDGGRRATRWRRIRHLEAQPEARESATLASDQRLDIAAELRKLAPRERACVVLRYYEDLKIDDVAEQLGISPGAVKRYVSDALGKLAASMSGGNGADRAR